VELSSSSLEIETCFKQVLERSSFDQSFWQEKMWKGRMMTWNAVLDCQRLTGSHFSDITATKTEIEAAAE
jgi:hypothetical protein